ncbi:MAG: hypothetical protein LRY73_09995 [Bacillus sp. (in: Bacteria)]|nr:hypothetical protein [Bacillus sp. (in: firmicutes)]
MFEALHNFSVGPLTVTMDMLMLIVSIAVGYGVIHVYLKQLEVKEREGFLDAVLTALIIAVILFKLWPFVLDPSLLQNPANLIYFMGGPFAVYVAIGVALFFLIFQSWRKKWTYTCWDSLFFGAVASFFVYSILIREYGAPSPYSVGYMVENTVYHPVNFYYGIVYGLLLLVCFYFVKKEIPFARSIFLLVGVVFVQFLLSPFVV